MYSCNLNNDWQLRAEALHCDKDRYGTVADKKDGWFDVKTLPCDVHVPLIESGVIGDPVIADNCVKCEWIEDRSWWFRKVFRAGNELLNSHNSELVIEGLDVHADLFLNGVYLGHHISAMYPFRKDVRDFLREGENVLVVRVTSGLEYYSELDIATVKDYVSCEYKRDRAPRGDNRRAILRKPQYVYGWDWSPRMATCGIMGDARIEAYNDIAIRSVKFITDAITGAGAKVSVEAEIETFYPNTTLDVTVDVDISFNNILVRSLEREVFMTSGLNYVRFEFTIDDPMLWWPNGMGEQNLYTVRVRARTANNHSDFYELKAGIRTLKLNTDRIDLSSRMFAFVINGITMFCKGGNWEVPDSIYGRITDSKYETLIKEAKEANFNMLRWNGVNAYERDYFYECCDRYGILIWQDFAFSCSAYPDELDWFRREVENEVDYQTRRLRNHPCVALWCGNNECLSLMIGYRVQFDKVNSALGNNERLCNMVGYRNRSHWDGDSKPVSPAGTRLYNEIMPRIVRRNCSEIPYWNSSPYGGPELESSDYGDRHYYDGFMNDDITKRIIPDDYDKVAGKFISEFGCAGPTKKSSLYKYYGSENVDMNSGIWKLHTNTFEKNTLKAAISKHYTGTDSITLDEYLLYGGLFQGMMLGYAFESLRYAENNHGALIWSYNDAWGEIGWSIIDYYSTRKISYYFVKRALAHTKLILREDKGNISVICMNDTKDILEHELEYGYMTFDGIKNDTVRKKITVKPFTKAVVVAQIKKGSHDTLKGAYYARMCENSDIAPATLRTTDFRNLLIPCPTIKVTELNECGGKIVFTVSSDKYAHGVHFGLNDGMLLSDEYFDLLPGESRKVTLLNDSNPMVTSNINPRSIYVRESCCRRS